MKLKICTHTRMSWTSHWLLRRNVCFWFLSENPVPSRSRWCDSSHENASHIAPLFPPKLWNVHSATICGHSSLFPWTATQEASASFHSITAPEVSQPLHKYHWCSQIYGRHHEGTRTLHSVEVNQKWHFVRGGLCPYTKLYMLLLHKY